MEAAGADLLPINHRILWGPDATQATPRVFDDLDLPAERRLDPLDETTLVVGAIGPDQLEPRKGSLERRKQELAPIVILDTGFMDEDLHDQPIGVHEHMALAAFDLLAAIVAAQPPFWLVLTD